MHRIERKQGIQNYSSVFFSTQSVCLKLCIQTAVIFSIIFFYCCVVCLAEETGSG